MRGDNCKLLSLDRGGYLAHAEYGYAAGLPVFFFHGWPSSRTMAELTDADARNLGVRIISPDRPGICDSTFQPKRKLLDWPDILKQLADHLQIERFHILAISGGAPYAYATAWKMPERVRAMAVVSGAPPIAELQDRQDLLGLYRLMLRCYGKYPRFSRTCFYLVRPFLSLRPPQGAHPLLLKLLWLRPSDAAALRDSAEFEAHHRRHGCLYTFLRDPIAGSCAVRIDWLCSGHGCLYSSPWKISPRAQFRTSQRAGNGVSMRHLMSASVN